jgi:hypothetical protein
MVLFVRRLLSYFYFALVELNAAESKSKHANA